VQLRVRIVSAARYEILYWCASAQIKNLQTYAFDEQHIEHN
jgi:hypothetical protein